MDLSVFLEELEYFRDAPGFNIDRRVAILWKHPWQIVDQTAAGDMGESLNHSGRRPSQERLIVLVHAQQFPADFARAQSHFFEQDFSGERVAIGVKTI